MFYQKKDNWTLKSREEQSRRTTEREQKYERKPQSWVKQWELPHMEVNGFRDQKKTTWSVYCTCGRWRPRSAPSNSRWSIWMCSPSAPCCCPRSGCERDNLRFALENSARRWRQSPPGQTGIIILWCKTFNICIWLTLPDNWSFKLWLIHAWFITNLLMLSVIISIKRFLGCFFTLV